MFDICCQILYVKSDAFWFALQEYSITEKQGIGICIISV